MLTGIERSRNNNNASAGYSCVAMQVQKNFVFQVFFPALLWLCRAGLMLPDDQHKDKRRGRGGGGVRRVSAE